VQLIKKVQPQVSGNMLLIIGFGISKPKHVKTVISTGADTASWEHIHKHHQKQKKKWIYKKSARLLLLTQSSDCQNRQS